MCWSFKRVYKLPSFSTRTLRLSTIACYRARPYEILCPIQPKRSNPCSVLTRILCRRTTSNCKSNTTAFDKSTMRYKSYCHRKNRFLTIRASSTTVSRLAVVFQALRCEALESRLVD